MRYGNCPASNNKPCFYSAVNKQTRRMIMKKVFSCVLVVLMLASMLVMSVGAVVRDDGLNHDYGTIANVERKSIRLDAIKEDVYDNATAIPIATISASNPEGRTSDASATAYVVYDSEYIWVFVEVDDATLATKAASALESSYKEDSIELVFDFANEGKNAAEESPYQCRLTHEGYISARIGQKGTTLQGTAEQGSQNPVNWLDGFALHRADGTGYDCEFKVTIPDNVVIGDQIGMNIMINDYDAEGKNRVMITSNSTDPACGEWKVNLYGNITLDDSNPYTADTTVIYVAIAMVAALAVGAITLVSLKKKAK